MYATDPHYDTATPSVLGSPVVYDLSSPASASAPQYVPSPQYDSANATQYDLANPTAFYDLSAPESAEDLRKKMEEEYLHVGTADNNDTTAFC